MLFFAWTHSQTKNKKCQICKNGVPIATPHHSDCLNLDIEFFGSDKAEFCCCFTTEDRKRCLEQLYGQNWL